ncbi:uncharacterized protein LOC122663026 [Telopea speciosissima]|uniref:uncharacterized protein LOC122663026 n=1 Tax=Telopea speciosissima TaxID=54955 RepID=UPI001CC621BF|nr:uncharacterized protein LOC122663026 [Telopea speciosissima]
MWGRRKRLLVLFTPRARARRVVGESTINKSPPLPVEEPLFDRACADGLASGSALNQRQIPVDNHCSRCGSAPETIEHILLYCPFARAVWFGSSLSAVILADVLGKSRYEEVTSHCSFIAWNLWCSRNDLLFGMKELTLAEVIVVARAACIEFLSTSNQKPLGQSRLAVSDKFNFTRILEGEAIAIREGLLEAISEGTYNLLLESDNQEIITYLKDTSKSLPLSVRPVVEDIRHLASYLDSCQFLYISRAANAVTNSLARRAKSIMDKTVWPNFDPCLTVPVGTEDSCVIRSIQ